MDKIDPDKWAEGIRKMKQKRKTMGEEWDSLPFQSQLRLPITVNVPNYFRWKILQLNLMLNDLKYLHDKHDILQAYNLYEVVAWEADRLCGKLTEIILEKQKEGENRG